MNPSADVAPDRRNQAAIELLEMGLPEAVQTIDAALRSREPAVVTSVACAIQLSRKASPELLDAALAALQDAPSEALEPLAWVIARFGAEAVEPVASMALDPAASPAARLGPIYALGAFHSRPAAAALMAIIQQPTGDQDSSSADVVIAACASMERVTGLAFGTDARRWAQWWQTVRAEPQEQWATHIVDSLANRLADTQQQVARQHRANERMAREVFETYRDLFPALSIDEQVRRLPRLLDDQLAPVREFGMNRIALMLRDSVRIGAEAQAVLAERLHDQSPGLRALAAKLLDELNYQGLEGLLAERLRIEQSKPVVVALLEVLARRPAAQVMEYSARWIGDPDLGEHAARAALRALDAPSSSPQEQRTATTAEACRGALSQRPGPCVARLLAVIGTPQDIHDLTSLLDGDNALMRGAVAEGFARRGLRQLLLDRASDQAVCPSAIRVIADGKTDLASLRLLLQIRPADPHRQLWVESATKLASALGPADWIAADDLLAVATDADLALRRELIARWLAGGASSIPTEIRIKLLARLVPMLIDNSEAARAFEMIEALNGDAANPALKIVRFHAAVLCGQYERAARLETGPGAWIEVLQRTAPRDPEAAKPLASEIALRFGHQLDPQEQALVERVLKDAQVQAQ